MEGAKKLIRSGFTDVYDNINGESKTVKLSGATGFTDVCDNNNGESKTVKLIRSNRFHRCL